ncbi:hypothetical protein NCAS_0G00970 [Naumovozyma castellii]|uniref:Flo11 domain-containing protein n=1 Tax=Naumovozyma castellii TaxID=27288 RepID=G0VHV0_NAUCA|nr:hypothetical protein NCAS_0G00970 [Naumovozyma castellii CBS 4309]CCC70984.1 hypothetical protein NCAS_0G00970 [Naumovozyma castellii CBS 4309]
MLPRFITTLLLASQLEASIINHDTSHELSKRTDYEVCKTVTNGCPDLDFSFKFMNENVMRYYIDLLNVKWISGNRYEIKIRVTGEEQIDLKYLYSLKIIGVQGPQGTIQLYGKNENTYLIDNPTDYTATFKVDVRNSDQTDDCYVWLPNFEIQYEYLQGDASKYEDTWVWGTTAFDLSTGCSSDNQGRAQTSFPGFYWPIRCDDDCKPPPPPPETTSTVPPPPPETTSTAPPPPPETTSTVPPPPPETTSTAPPPPPETTSTAPPPPPETTSTVPPPPPPSESTAVPPPPPESTTVLPPPPGTTTAPVPPPPEETTTTLVPPPPEETTTVPASTISATTLQPSPTVPAEEDDHELQPFEGAATMLDIISPWFILGVIVLFL